MNEIAYKAALDIMVYLFDNPDNWIQIDNNTLHNEMRYYDETTQILRYYSEEEIGKGLNILIKEAKIQFHYTLIRENKQLQFVKQIISKRNNIINSISASSKTQ